MREGPVALRPVRPDDAPALRAIHETDEVRRWWGVPPADFPADDPDAARLTILVDGAVAGLIQFYEDDDPDFRSASIDIFLGPAFHGRGHGTTAIRLLMRHLAEERGHHRITIDPAADNAAAIRAYGKSGFTPVGVMRAAWRDPDGEWRDLLLMEWVDPAVLSRT